MQIKYSSEKVHPVSTDTKPTQYELTLTAIGNYQEIIWLEKQINKIGEAKCKQEK